MRKLAAGLLFSASLVCLAPAEAQIFGRKSKTPPAQRIGELISQAQSDPSESKRAAAAEELRDFDPKAFPEVVPVLIDIAKSDKSANVRYEALDSLSRLRPVTQPAGQALEWAAAHDDSLKVRWHAKTALSRYQWAGYRATKGDSKNPTPPATKEPPLLDTARPSAKSGAVARTPAKSAQPSASNNAAPPPLPTIINQPPSAPEIVTQPQVVQQPQAPLAPTPPPIIIEAPPGTATAPPLKVPVPAVPVVAPTVPGEPNFRPAGQTPPRVPPLPKTDDRGPALTPPM